MYMHSHGKNLRVEWNGMPENTSIQSLQVGNFAIGTEAVSCENQSTTTTSSTISELPTTPPDDAQLTLVQTSDDENWPPPPSPISEACTSTTPVSSGGEQTEATQGSSSPVVRFTFTVKLDSQLLKRRRQPVSYTHLTLPTIYSV